MPLIRETGKDRWRKVPKDYFKKRDRLQNLKLQLSGLACLLALGWFALGLDWSDSRSANDLNGLRANHGELARAHSAWANKCDACHVPFEPIDGRPLLSSKSVAEGRSSDKLCSSCHAGPAHHSTMIASEVKGCAECHRDHQGRDFSLVRLNDNECTSCHGALEAHIASGSKLGNSRMFGKVIRFNEKDHPPFRPEAATFDASNPPRDKGKLKFNHALHMMPGIVRDSRETPYTVEQIPIIGERARYQKSGSVKDPVQLDCTSCHDLDASEIKAAANPALDAIALPLRNSGRYYLPISYGNQCRACHTQTFDPRPGLKDLEVPHGVQPDQITAYLKRTYAAQIVADDPSLLNRKVTATRLPGKSLAETTAAKLLDDSVTKATRFLFENRTSCNECHHLEKNAQGLATKVERTNVPQVWFTHAAFDHTAHRGVSCRDCHARSYAMEADGKTPVKDSSKVSSDVLIPAIDNCVQCHAPSKSPGGWFASNVSATTGGASFDCTECHRYHNGDNLLQGYGASAELAREVRTIAEFLRGSDGPGPKNEAKKAEQP